MAAGRGARGGTSEARCGRVGARKPRRRCRTPHCCGAQHLGGAGPARGPRSGASTAAAMPPSPPSPPPPPPPHQPGSGLASAVEPARRQYGDSKTVDSRGEAASPKRSRARSARRRAGARADSPARCGPQEICGTMRREKPWRRSP